MQYDLKAAKKFYEDHTDHVTMLVNSTLVSYPPSGSDAIRPELWKSAHWRWYVLNHMNQTERARFKVDNFRSSDDDTWWDVILDFLSLDWMSHHGDHDDHFDHHDW